MNCILPIDIINIILNMCHKNYYYKLKEITYNNEKKANKINKINKIKLCFYKRLEYDKLYFNINNLILYKSNNLIKEEKIMINDICGHNYTNLDIFYSYTFDTKLKRCFICESFFYDEPFYTCHLCYYNYSYKYNSDMKIILFIKSSNKDNFNFFEEGSCYMKNETCQLVREHKYNDNNIIYHIM